MGVLYGKDSELLVLWRFRCHGFNSSDWLVKSNLGLLAHSERFDSAQAFSGSIVKRSFLKKGEK